MIFHAPRCMGGTCTCMTENGRKENNRCAKAQGCAGEEEKTDQVIQIALC